MGIKIATTASMEIYRWVNERDGNDYDESSASIFQIVHLIPQSNGYQTQIMHRKTF